MAKIIKIEDNYYISANSTYADDRVLVLNSGDTFGVFDRWGDISPLGKDVQGIYHKGTRFVSEQELKINGERPLLLSSGVTEENEILNADFTNPDLSYDEHLLSKGNIYINRSKFIYKGICHEKIQIANYSLLDHDLKISITLSGDFKDIFEIRGMKRKKHGIILDNVNRGKGAINFSYIGIDNIKRSTIAFFDPEPDVVNDHTAEFNIHLKKQKKFEITLRFMFEIDDERAEDIGYKNALNELNRKTQNENKKIADVCSQNEHFNHWINRSKSDLLSLVAETPFGKYPYAGVPWYNTPFGRDGLITAYEVLWVAPQIAKGVLQYVARTQATELIPEKDAEPGKIFHETREGEMCGLDELPFKLYYGTIDATPLFIMLAGAYYTRTADLGFIKKIWPNIISALNWIDKYGDIDGDGFVEYSKHSEKGLVNQGWKDSYDSISHADGNLAESPIALCEVQGYVYDAKIQASLLANVLGEEKLAAKLSREAEELKLKFNKQFWDEDLNCFVIALDKNKKPCSLISSNAGHTLFTGIADKEKAARLIKTLLDNEMFTGYGIRTLSEREVRYNPMSYHNGSIWPHDTALIAYGFSRYGFQKEVLKVMEGMFEAALHFDLRRLPELFCGFSNTNGKAPIEYPVACSPQAWSVASVYMLLQACLGLKIDAPEKKLLFNKPLLPGFISTLEIKNLLLNKNAAAFLLRKHKHDTGINIIEKEEEWDVVLVK